MRVYSNYPHSLRRNRAAGANLREEAVNWFERMKTGIKSLIKREIPQGIWIKCKKCGHSNYEMALRRRHWICPECACHYPIGHQQYIDLLIDDGTFTEINANVAPVDPLKFKGYKDKIKKGRRESGTKESVLHRHRPNRRPPRRLGDHGLALSNGHVGRRDRREALPPHRPRHGRTDAR